MEQLPDVYAGQYEDNIDEDMKRENDPSNDYDDDEDRPADAELINILGFDPDKEDWGNEEEE